MRNIVTLVALAALTGCANTPQQAAAFASLKAQYNASLPSASVYCPDKPTCEKAWSLTKIFINANSTMRIRESDEALISTYYPSHYGEIGFNATRTPDAGSSATISMEVLCKGVQDELKEVVEVGCLSQMANINNAFKPFITSRMN